MADLADRLKETAGRARYTAAQSARVAWYSAQYLLARRLSAPFDRPGEPKFRPASKPGDPKRIRKAFLDLFAMDRANIEAGLYPPPEDFDPRRLPAALAHALAFFQDLPRVDARRLARDGVEVRRDNARGDYPAYYLQNFHYQSGGWLSEESATLYDTQVEILFAGAAAAMRRIALGGISRALSGIDQRRARMLDLACGSGAFLADALRAFPKLNATGLDLSPAYADEARGRIARWPQADVVVGRAEATPFPDGHFDAVSSIYLFHELPPKVRREVAREIGRIVKPGGGFVFADSLQPGDAPDLDQMLEYFPHGFHEPFYLSYLGEDLVALFGEAGFEPVESTLAFLTKVIRFRKV